jgi:hypothetical protein
MGSQAREKRLEGDVPGANHVGYQGTQALEPVGSKCIFFFGHMLRKGEKSLRRGLQLSLLGALRAHIGLTDCVYACLVCGPPQRTWSRTTSRPLWGGPCF